jgi:hypothetical protein
MANAQSTDTRSPIAPGFAVYRTCNRGRRATAALTGILLVLALMATSAAAAFVPLPGTHMMPPKTYDPNVPNKTVGYIKCSDGTPLANCTVTATFYDSNGPVTSGTTTTDATGYFELTLACSGSNQINEYMVFTAFCCSDTWTFPSTCCCGDFGTLICTSCGCVKPPKKMVGWWPFDEPSGSIAHDVAGGNHATWAGAPVVTAGQYVANSIHFSTASDYVEKINPSSLLNMGVGDYSIDAWVRTRDLTTAVRTIVDHREMAPRPHGYTLYMSYGRIGCQIADGVGIGYNNWTSPAPLLWDGVWHHVALSVKRNSTTGGILYVDGAVALVFDPTVRAGNLDNKGPLRIGQAVDGSSLAWAGDIDEVEIFKRALSATEVSALYKAGTHGKCKEYAYLTTPLGVCPTTTSVTTNLLICNATLSTQTYTWSMAPLGIGVGCTVNGPTGFTPSSGSVTLLSGQCTTVPVVIANPGLSSGQTACYRATITNTGNGNSFLADGKLYGVPPIWCAIGQAGVISARLGSISRGVFTVTNTTDTPQTLTYEISAASADGDPEAARVLSLWGLPPGEPYIGTLHVDAGGSADIPVEIEALDYESFTPQVITLATSSSDGRRAAPSAGGETIVTDADAPLASMLVATFSETPTGVLVATPPEVTRLTALPTPFAGRTEVQFQLRETQPVRVDVIDAAGRTVRVIHDGTLGAGAHALGWDGRDDTGRFVTAGVYVIRVSTADRLSSAKVMRLR